MFIKLVCMDETPVYINTSSINSVGIEFADCKPEYYTVVRCNGSTVAVKETPESIIEMIGRR